MVQTRIHRGKGRERRSAAFLVFFSVATPEARLIPRLLLEELKRLELDLQAALKEQEQTATASTSAAGVHPLDPLADQASSTKSGSWWKFF